MASPAVKYVKCVRPLEIKTQRRRENNQSQLGDSGLKISQIILGGMSFGDKNWQPWVLDQEEAIPIIKYAFDRGINTWDVADAYSNGRSEEIIGNAIKKLEIPRSKLVIMTKCFHYVDETHGPISPGTFNINDGKQVNLVGLSRKHIMDAVDKSIERLGTYIDVLQVHRLDQGTPGEEIMKALNDVIESGKARYIGASSGFYNLLYREEEREMIPYCKATGVGLVPWSPLGAGVLTHPWSDRSDPREQSDVFLKLLFRSREDSADQAIVQRVEQLATKKGLSMAQITIAWVLAKGEISPICGLETRERIDQAISALSVSLSDDEVRFLEEPYLPREISGY
ncbi:aldo-keto reductase [Ilyonectria robusta]